MAFPEDLLEQAQHLARREPKRPKQASLRRAVSAAYYALFHLLIAEATRNWKRAAQRHSLGRAFDHGQMRTACEKKRKELTAYLNGDPSPSPQRVLSQHLHTVTDTFIQLQQQRQTADYDSGKQWSRKEVSFLLTNLEGAFGSWKAIRDDDTAQEYLVKLPVKDRPR